MLNIAIIGTGNISSSHIKGYLKFPERCKITALVDIYPEKAKKKIQDFGLEDVKVYASHQELINDTEQNLDLADICTPPYCHAEIAIDFLNYKKHVIVEKPMAASLEECDAMIEASKKNGKILSSIAQNRFLDPIMNLKAVLDSGKIGRVVHAQIDSHWWRGHCYYDLWWRGCWDKEGGGCTLNHAVHHIDMLSWMLGTPTKISAMMSNASHDNAEVEDISVAVMQYDNGTLAQVTSSVIHHGEEQQIIFQGEKARISAPWKVYASVSKPNGFPERDEAVEKDLEEFYATLPHLEHTGHEGQIDNVMTAIETGGEPFVTGEQGRRTIELITAIYKAGTEQRTVDFPILSDDPFYTVEGILKNVPRFYEKSTSKVELSEDEISVGGKY